MMHIVNNMMKILRLNVFSTTKCHKQMDDSIDSKSKPLHSVNIWTNNINHPRLPILVTNTINIEHYMIYNCHSIT